MISIESSRELLSSPTEAELKLNSTRLLQVELVLVDQPLKIVLLKVLRRLRTQQLGFFTEHLTVAQLQRLRQQTRELKIKCVARMNAITAQRRVKSAAEVKLMQRAGP